MIYAIIVVISIIFLYKFDYCNQKNGRTQCYLFLWLLLVLVAGLRFRVGADTLSYMDMYLTKDYLYEMQHYSLDSPNGYLWYAFCYLCQKINNDFTTLQIIHAIIVNTAVFYFFIKHSTKPFTAVFIYILFFFLYYNTEILRASLSLSVFLFIGYDALVHKRWIVYILSVVIAVGFHVQSIVLLIFPFALVLGKIKFNTVSLAVVLSIAVILYFVFDAVSFFSDFFRFSEALEYRNGLYSRTTDRNIREMIAKSISIIPYVMTFLYFSPKNDSLKTNKEVFLKKGFLILYIIFSVQALNYPVYFSRILDYARPIVVICLINYLFFYRSKYKTILVWIVFATLSISLYTNYGSDWFRYYPYHSVLDPEIVKDRESIFGI